MGYKWLMDKKKFGGKTWTVYSVYGSRKDAQEQAGKMSQQTKIVKTSQGYALYYR